jgi:taurine dioxygenase
MINLLRFVALASVTNLSAAETAELYGAAAPATLLPHYRRDWSYCTANLCGGASRLGALLDVGNLRELRPEGADKINDAVRAYGVVVIKNQNLTRAEQVKFTGLLGEPVALAKSFYGKDPEPNQPSILRVTNFWAPKHNMLSIVHAQQVPPRGGETGFVDMRAARATLSAPLCVEIKFTARSYLHAIDAIPARWRGDVGSHRSTEPARPRRRREHPTHWLNSTQAPLLERAAKAAIHASVREIKDFRGGDEEDFNMFPKVAVHPLLANHYVDSGPLLYVGSPHMKVHGCVEINQCVGRTAKTRPCWLRRAVRNRHLHAVEEASRRWRGGRRDERAVKF